MFFHDILYPWCYVDIVSSTLLQQDIVVFTDAYANARFLCEQYYLTSPDLKIESYNRKYLKAARGLYET